MPSSARTRRVRAALGDTTPLAPLTSAELAEAEHQFGVTLPPDYRDFLVNVDAGGPGPVNFRRLLHGPEGWHWENDRETALDRLAMPFPDQVAFADRYASFAGSEAEEREMDREQTSGAIHLADEGHNFSTLLVVSGPERGHMWFDRRPTSDTIIPFLHPDGTPATFADVYDDWLRTAEHLLDTGHTTLRRQDIWAPIYESRFDF